MMKVTVHNVFVLVFAMLLAVPGFSQKQISKSRHFKVTSLKSNKIGPEVKAKLINAYAAQFGKKPCSVAVSERSGKPILWFVACDNGGPTLGLELRKYKFGLGIDMGGPLGINNCQTQEGCEACNIDCECKKGSGSCKLTKTENVLGSTYPQMESALID